MKKGKVASVLAVAAWLGGVAPGLNGAGGSEGGDRLGARAAEAPRESQVMPARRGVERDGPTAGSSLGSRDRAGSPRQSPSGVAEKSPPRGEATRGKTLFVRFGCYQCHGRVAQGGAAGPRLGPPPISFPAFLRAVRQPNQMPPYSEQVLTEQDVADIHAFVGALPRPPSVEEVPLLRRLRQ